MRRYPLAIVLTAIFTIVCLQFVGHSKAFSDSTSDLLTTPSDINAMINYNTSSNVGYKWVDANTITATFPKDNSPNVNSSGIVVTFYANNDGGLNDLYNGGDTQFFAASNGQCNAGGANGAATIDVVQPNPNYSTNDAQWKFIAPNSNSCTALPSGQPYTHIHIEDPGSGINLASNIIFTYNQQTYTISTVDGSLDDSSGVLNFTEVSGANSIDANIYKISSGSCQDEIVVNSDGSADFWPLTTSANGDFIIKNDQAAQNANAVGCGSGSGSTISGLVSSIAGGKNSTDGSSPVYVPGLKYITCGANGSTGCTAAGQPINTASAKTGNNGDCVSSGGSFSWFICGAIDTVVSAENVIIKTVDDLLATNPININKVKASQADSAACVAADTNSQSPGQNQSFGSSACINNGTFANSTYKVWSTFRIYGDIVLVIAMLSAIIAEIVGGGVIEAYTVKKMLPRILVAAILINLSFYIVLALEDIINVIGGGIEGLLEAPFKSAGLSVHISGGTGVLATTALGVTATLVGFSEGIAGIALFILGSLLLAALSVLVTLMFRQGLLVVLLMVSPIAFALYVLPNTEQYFRKWWDLLIKTLLVYPIVKVVFAIAFISAIVVSNFNIQPQILGQLMAIAAACVPLFLIPFAFKLSGGAIAGVNSAVNGVRDKLKAPIDNMRKQNRAHRIERARGGKLFRGGETGLGAAANRYAQNAMLLNKAGLKPRNMRSNLSTARSEIDQQEIDKNMKENATLATYSGDDDLNRAASESNNEAELRAALIRADQRRVARGDAARFNDPVAMDEAVSRVQRVRRGMSQEAFRRMSTLNALAGGTAYDSADEAWEAVARAAGNDDAAMSNLIAKGKSSLMQAGRVDQGGASFGTTLNSVRAMRDELRTTGAVSQQTRDTVNNEIYGSAADSASPAQAMYGKPSSARHLAEAHANRINDLISQFAAADNGVNVHGANSTLGKQAAAERDRAERELNQAMASSAGLYDAMASASPVNAREYADGLTGRGFSLGTLPPQIASNFGGSNNMLEAMNYMRDNNVDFQEMRRDLGASAAAQARQAAAAGLAPGVAQQPQIPFGGPPSTI